MNAYIESIKGAIYTYKQRRDNATERIKETAEVYGKEAGDREKEIQSKKLAPYRAEAEAAIKEAYRRGVSGVNDWAKLDGAKLTDDAKLLDADLVSKEDFEALKAKYAGNYTMLQALRRYGDRHNEMERQENQKNGWLALGEAYKTKDIPTAEEKLHNWDLAQKQALHLLDVADMDGDQGDWGKAFEIAAFPQQLEHFGEGRNY